MCTSNQSPASCYQAIQAGARHCPNPSSLAPMVATVGDLHKPWSSSPSPSPPSPSPPQPQQRPRARRRVLYPPFARPMMPKERPDVARRWLMLLSALLFLQIYTEEGGACCTCPISWDPLQAGDGVNAATHCMAPMMMNSGGGGGGGPTPHLPECEAPRGELQLGREGWESCGASGEMMEVEVEQCSELCVSLPARVQSLVA